MPDLTFPWFRGQRLELQHGRLWPMPKPDQFLADLATALGREFRWNGTTRRQISVAEHSILVRDLVREEVYLRGADPDPDLELLALIHDAHEAFTGDIAFHLKEYLKKYTPAVAELEAELDYAVAAALDLPPLTITDEGLRILKGCDQIAARTEAEYLFDSLDGWPAEFRNAMVPVKLEALYLQTNGRGPVLKDYGPDGWGHRYELELRQAIAAQFVPF